MRAARDAPPAGRRPDATAGPRRRHDRRGRHGDRRTTHRGLGRRARGPRHGGPTANSRSARAARHDRGGGPARRSRPSRAARSAPHGPGRATGRRRPDEATHAAGPGHRDPAGHPSSRPDGAPRPLGHHRVTQTRGCPPDAPTARRRGRHGRRPTSGCHEQLHPGRRRAVGHHEGLRPGHRRNRRTVHPRAPLREDPARDAAPRRHRPHGRRTAHPNDSPSRSGDRRRGVGDRRPRVGPTCHRARVPATGLGRLTPSAGPRTRRGTDAPRRRDAGAGHDCRRRETSYRGRRRPVAGRGRRRSARHRTPHHGGRRRAHRSGRGRGARHRDENFRGYSPASCLGGHHGSHHGGRSRGGRTTRGSSPTGPTTNLRLVRRSCPVHRNRSRTC